MASLTKVSNLELLDLPNCAGLLETGKCRWLRVPCCKGDGCSFRQTNEQLHASSVRAMQRQSMLSEKKQARVAEKYYGGRRPWTKSC